MRNKQSINDLKIDFFTTKNDFYPKVDLSEQKIKQKKFRVWDLKVIQENCKF